MRGSPPRCPSAGECCCECECADLEGARLEQRVGGGVECTARRQHIIDEPYACCRTQTACGTKRASHVLTSFASDQPRLVARVMNPLEGIGEPRSPKAACNSARDGIGMVEPAPATAARVERDAHDEIGSRRRLFGHASGQFDCEMIDRKADRNGWTKGTPSGLEAGNPAPNAAFVANQRAATV